MVQVNLGQAQGSVNAARDTALAACRAADERLVAGQIPDEADYLGQLSAASTALQLCADAMTLLLRVMGDTAWRVNALMRECWTALRQAVLGHPPCRPRIWAT